MGMIRTVESTDVEELEALLEAEEAVEEHCRRLLNLARARIRELEAGLAYSCEVAAAEAAQITDLQGQVSALGEQVAALQTDNTTCADALAAASTADAACEVEVARLNAGLATLQAELDALLHPQPGVPVSMTVTFDPPTNRI